MVIERICFSLLFYWGFAKFYYCNEVEWGKVTVAVVLRIYYLTLPFGSWLGASLLVL